MFPGIMAEITGAELFGWVNTSFLAAAFVMFATGIIVSAKVVENQMLGPLREENRELRDMNRQLVATCERQAEINEGLAHQNAGLAAQLADLAGRALGDNANRGGGNRQ